MSFNRFKMLLPFVREAQPTTGARDWTALRHQEPHPALGAPLILPLSCTGHPAPPAMQEPAVPKAGKTFLPSLSHLCCMSVPLWLPWAWIRACRAPPAAHWLQSQARAEQKPRYPTWKGSWLVPLRQGDMDWCRGNRAASSTRYSTRLLGRMVL